MLCFIEYVQTWKNKNISTQWTDTMQTNDVPLKFHDVCLLRHFFGQLPARSNCEFSLQLKTVKTSLSVRPYLWQSSIQYYAYASLYLNVEGSILIDYF